MGARIQKSIIFLYQSPVPRRQVFRLELSGLRRERKDHILGYHPEANQHSHRSRWESCSPPSASSLTKTGFTQTLASARTCSPTYSTRLVVAILLARSLSGSGRPPASFPWPRPLSTPPLRSALSLRPDARRPRPLQRGPNLS